MECGARPRARWCRSPVSSSMTPPSRGRGLAEIRIPGQERQPDRPDGVVPVWCRRGTRTATCPAPGGRRAPGRPSEGAMSAGSTWSTVQWPAICRAGAATCRARAAGRHAASRSRRVPAPVSDHREARGRVRHPPDSSPSRGFGRRARNRFDLPSSATDRLRPPVAISITSVWARAYSQQGYAAAFGCEFDVPDVLTSTPRAIGESACAGRSTRWRPRCSRRSGQTAPPDFDEPTARARRALPTRRGAAVVGGDRRGGVGAAGVLVGEHVPDGAASGVRGRAGVHERGRGRSPRSPAGRHGWYTGRAGPSWEERAGRPRRRRGRAWRESAARRRSRIHVTWLPRCEPPRPPAPAWCSTPPSRWAGSPPTLPSPTPSWRAAIAVAAQPAWTRRGSRCDPAWPARAPPRGLVTTGARRLGRASTGCRCASAGRTAGLRHFARAGILPGGRRRRAAVAGRLVDRAAVQAPTRVGLGRRVLRRRSARPRRAPRSSRLRHPATASPRLAAAGVVASARAGAARLAFHLSTPRTTWTARYGASSPWIRRLRTPGEDPAPTGVDADHPRATPGDPARGGSGEGLRPASRRPWSVVLLQERPPGGLAVGLLASDREPCAADSRVGDRLRRRVGGLRRDGPLPDLRERLLDAPAQLAVHVRVATGLALLGLDEERDGERVAPERGVLGAERRLQRLGRLSVDGRRRFGHPLTPATPRTSCSRPPPKRSAPPGARRRSARPARLFRLPQRPSGAAHPEWPHRRVEVGPGRGGDRRRPRLPGHLGLQRGGVFRVRASRSGPTRPVRSGVAAITAAASAASARAASASATSGSGACACAERGGAHAASGGPSSNAASSARRVIVVATCPVIRTSASSRGRPSCQWAPARESAERVRRSAVTGAIP